MIEIQFKLDNSSESEPSESLEENLIRHCSNVVCAIYSVALFTQLQCKIYTVFEILKFEVRVKELTILEFVSWDL